MAIYDIAGIRGFLLTISILQQMQIIVSQPASDVTTVSPIKRQLYIQSQHSEYTHQPNTYQQQPSYPELLPQSPPGISKALLDYLRQQQSREGLPKTIQDYLIQGPLAPRNTPSEQQQPQKHQHQQQKQQQQHQQQRQKPQQEQQHQPLQQQQQQGWKQQIQGPQQKQQQQQKEQQKQQQQWQHQQRLQQIQQPQQHQPLQQQQLQHIQQKQQQKQQQQEQQQQEQQQQQGQQQQLQKKQQQQLHQQHKQEPQQKQILQQQQQQQLVQPNYQRDKQQFNLTEAFQRTKDIAAVVPSESIRTPALQLNEQNIASQNPQRGSSDKNVASLNLQSVLQQSQLDPILTQINQSTKSNNLQNLLIEYLGRQLLKRMLNQQASTNQTQAPSTSSNKFNIPRENPASQATPLMPQTMLSSHNSSSSLQRTQTQQSDQQNFNPEMVQPSLTPAKTSLSATLNRTETQRNGTFYVAQQKYNSAGQSFFNVSGVSQVTVPQAKVSTFWTHNANITEKHTYASPVEVLSTETADPKVQQSSELAIDHVLKQNIDQLQANPGVLTTHSRSLFSRPELNTQNQSPFVRVQAFQQNLGFPTNHVLNTNIQAIQHHPNSSTPEQNVFIGPVDQFNPVPIQGPESIQQQRNGILTEMANPPESMTEAENLTPKINEQTSVSVANSNSELSNSLKGAETSNTRLNNSQQEPSLGVPNTFQTMEIPSLQNTKSKPGRVRVVYIPATNTSAGFFRVIHLTVPQPPVSPAKGILPSSSSTIAPTQGYFQNHNIDNKQLTQSILTPQQKPALIKPHLENNTIINDKQQVQNSLIISDHPPTNYAILEQVSHSQVARNNNLVEVLQNKTLTTPGPEAVLSAYPPVRVQKPQYPQLGPVFQRDVLRKQMIQQAIRNQPDSKIDKYNQFVSSQQQQAINRQQIQLAGPSVLKRAYPYYFPTVAPIHIPSWNFDKYNKFVAGQHQKLQNTVTTPVTILTPYGPASLGGAPVIKSPASPPGFTLNHVGVPMPRMPPSTLQRDIYGSPIPIFENTVMGMVPPGSSHVVGSMSKPQFQLQGTRQSQNNVKSSSFTITIPRSVSLNNSNVAFNPLNQPVSVVIGSTASPPSTSFPGLVHPAVVNPFTIFNGTLSNVSSVVGPKASAVASKVATSTIITPRASSMIPRVTTLATIGPPPITFSPELMCTSQSECEIGCCFTMQGDILWDWVIQLNPVLNQVGYCRMRQTLVGDACDRMFCPCSGQDQSCMSIPPANFTMPVGYDPTEMGPISFGKCYSNAQQPPSMSHLNEAKMMVDMCLMDPACPLFVKK